MANEQPDGVPDRHSDGSADRVPADAADRDALDGGLKLYFISAVDDPDVNQDLLVGAEDPDEAVGHWRNYYQRGPGDFPGHVFLVPPPMAHGAMRWHTDLIDQVVRGLCIKEAAMALGLETETCPDCGELHEETINSTSSHWECVVCGAWHERKIPL